MNSRMSHSRSAAQTSRLSGRVAASSAQRAKPSSRQRMLSLASIG
jgi:hypothetical protein